MKTFGWEKIQQIINGVKEQREKDLLSSLFLLCWDSTIENKNVSRTTRIQWKWNENLSYKILREGQFPLSCVDFNF